MSSQKIYTTQDVDIMARTIYGEARGEYFRADGGISSLVCVGNVICNRAKSPKRYGDGMIKVCQKPFQFSCWNPRDPNYVIITRIKRHEDKIFNLCYEVSRNILQGRWPDLTEGANHYHAAWMKVYPAWALGHKPTKRMGQHLFYHL
jgi:spore germination cell wall hydrolase CwlJ-like protein